MSFFFNISVRLSICPPASKSLKSLFLKKVLWPLKKLWVVSINIDFDLLSDVRNFLQSSVNLLQLPFLILDLIQYLMHPCCLFHDSFSKETLRHASARAFPEKNVHGLL